MSSSDDSDDDVPLSQLKTSLKTKKTPSKKIKSATKKKKTPTKKKKTPARKTKQKSSSEEESESESEYEEESESASSDDETSLADLKKLAAAKKKKAASAKGKKKKASSSKKRSRSKSKSSSKKKSKKTSRKNKAKSNATGILGATLISTYKDADGARKAVNCQSMTKQQIVTAILCRWWYAFDWPTSENLENARKEMVDTKNYRELSGMPGVFICILGEDTGKLIDKRNFNAGIVPSVANLMKKSSGELIDLWTQALKGQIKALEESETEKNTDLLKALNKELTTVNKLNRDKIEKACQRQNKSSSKKKKAIKILL